jgi:hypothetical protein
VRLIAGSNTPHRPSEVDLAGMERRDHAPEVRFLGREGLDPGSGCGSITVTSGLDRTQRLGADAAPFVVVGYRGVRVVQGMVSVDGLRVSLPFAGGALDPDGFTASAYLAPGAVIPAVITLVVVCQPALSHLERRALDRLPDENGREEPGGRDAGAPPARLIELREALVLAGRQP